MWSRAAAHAEVRGPEAGLTLLDQIDSQAVMSYQPYWAVRAHFLRQLGLPQATEAYDRAIGLSDDPPSVLSLTERRNRLTPQ